MFKFWWTSPGASDDVVCQLGIDIPCWFKLNEFPLTIEPMVDEFTPGGIKWAREFSLPIGYNDDEEPGRVLGAEDKLL